MIGNNVFERNLVGYVVLIKFNQFYQIK